MIIKGLQDELFGDYKKPAMQIVFPYCSFKCDYENGCEMCQNSSLAHEPTIDISANKIVERYLENPITKAIVCGGLEPFDSETELLHLVRTIRANCIEDDIVIYTGYTEEELKDNSYYRAICQHTNIIVKFGRFRPNQEPHFDEVLGVKLASDNQYAKKVSYERI